MCRWKTRGRVHGVVRIVPRSGVLSPMRHFDSQTGTGPSATRTSRTSSIIRGNPCLIFYLEGDLDPSEIFIMSKDESMSVDADAIHKKEQSDEEELPEAPQNDADQAKRRPKRKKSNPTSIKQTTLRKPRWTYLRIALHSSPPISQPIDSSTARLHLTSALRQFLGLTGEAIPIDFLKLEGPELWIRVPREDGDAVATALGGWVGGSDGATVGWRIKGRDDWLSRLSGGDGMDLFGG